MAYFLAILPILVVLGLMIGVRWGGQQAGPVGWLAGLVIAFAYFGLTPQALWVSQLKGLYLSFTVLLILWPAMFLYHLVDGFGGIMAIASYLKRLVADQGLLLIMLTWAFSGMLEGLAGYGLPIAVVSPMLVGMGVSPVLAVTASAVGHSWAVTFGDMGIVYQTLISVTGINGASLAPIAAFLLGLACLFCGLLAAFILKQGRLWPMVALIAVFMAGVQYAMAVLNLTPMSAFGAGLTGVVVSVLASKTILKEKSTLPVSPIANSPLEKSGLQGSGVAPGKSFALKGALLSYGSLAGLMSIIALVGPIHDAFNSVLIRADFPQVATTGGFITPSSAQIFRPLVHPGISVILIVVVSYGIYSTVGWRKAGALKKAAQATWNSASASSMGVIAMIGLSMIMDHSGMTLLLARGAAQVFGEFFPLVSPLVGILGAFATGSNNNSNVLFAVLQQNAAVLLGIDPRVLVAAQTTGGALGSMLAPAKIIVGCSTVGLKSRDGDVLRRTVPFGLAVGILIGLVALVLSRI